MVWEDKIDGVDIIYAKDVNDIAHLAIEASETAKNVAYIGENGHWFVYDTKIKAYKDSGQPATAYAEAVKNGFVGTVNAWLESLEGEPGPRGESGLPDRVVCHNGSFDGGVTMTLNPDLYNNHHYEFTFDENNTAGSITAKIKLNEDAYDTPSDTSKSSAITVRYDSIEGVSLVLCDGNYDSSAIVWSGAEPTFTPGYTYFLSFVPLSDTRILGAWSEVPTV